MSEKEEGPVFVSVQKTNRVEGVVERLPKVGESFWVGDNFRTSSIREVTPAGEGCVILSTKNSTYVVNYTPVEE